MKKTLILLSLLFILTLVNAQNFNSFRYLSTGGALDGDVEYAFDPLDLHYLDGIRFFSGLSNYSGDDRIFSNQSDNYLLLGTATDKTFLKNLKAALLFQYYDQQVPQEINCYADPFGDEYVSAMGQAEYTWQGYWDTNNNQLYDYYMKRYQKYENIDTDKGTDLYLVLSHKLGENKVLGYKLGYISNTSTGTSANSSLLGFDHGDPSTLVIDTNHNLPDMDPSVDTYTENTTWLGDFNSETVSTTLRNQVAFMKQGDKWEFAGYYTLDLITTEYTSNDIASTFEENTDGLVQDKYESNNHGQDTSSMDHQLTGRVRYTLVPDADHAHSGYVSGAFGLLFGTGSSELKSDLYSDIWVTDSNHHEWTWQNTSYDIDGSRMGFLAQLKLNYPLNNSTFLGTGLFFNHYNSTLEGDYNYEQGEEDTLFDDTGTTWEAISRIVSKSAGKIEQESSRSTLSVPVGLEYWFTHNQKWAMRFGSQFNRETNIDKYSYTPTLVEPTMIQVIYPDGSQEQDVTDNISLLESTSYKRVSCTTDFSYGLGYKASKNLQIDLLSMFEDTDSELWSTDFLRSLRLSFTLVFN